MSLSDPYHAPKKDRDTLVFNLDVQRTRARGFTIVAQCTFCGAAPMFDRNNLPTFLTWLEEHYDGCEG